MTFIFDSAGVEVLAGRMDTASNDADATAADARRALAIAGLASATPEQLVALAEDYRYASGILRLTIDALEGSEVTLESLLAATGIDEITGATRLELLNLLGVTEPADVLGALFALGDEVGPPASVRELLPGLPPEGIDPETDALVARLDEAILAGFNETGAIDPNAIGRDDLIAVIAIGLGRETLPIETGEVDANGEPVTEDVPLSALSGDELVALAGGTLVIGAALRQFDADAEAIFGPTEREGEPSGEPEAGIILAAAPAQQFSPGFEQQLDDLERRQQEAEGDPAAEAIIEDEIQSEIRRREVDRTQREAQRDASARTLDGSGFGLGVVGGLIGEGAARSLPGRILGGIRSAFGIVGGAAAGVGATEFVENANQLATEDVERLTAEIEALEDLLDDGSDTGGGEGDGPETPETGDGGGDDGDSGDGPPIPVPRPDFPPIPEPRPDFPPIPEPRPDFPPIPEPRPEPPPIPEPRPTPPIPVPRPEPVVPIDPSFPIAGDPGDGSGTGGPLDPIDPPIPEPRPTPPPEPPPIPEPRPEPGEPNEPPPEPPPIPEPRPEPPPEPPPIPEPRPEPPPEPPPVPEPRPEPPPERESSGGGDSGRGRDQDTKNGSDSNNGSTDGGRDSGDGTDNPDPGGGLE